MEQTKEKGLKDKEAEGAIKPNEENTGCRETRRGRRKRTEKEDAEKEKKKQSGRRKKRRRR